MAAVAAKKKADRAVAKAAKAAKESTRVAEESADRGIRPVPLSLEAAIVNDSDSPRSVASEATDTSEEDETSAATATAFTAATTINSTGNSSEPGDQKPVMLSLQMAQTVELESPRSVVSEASDTSEEEAEIGVELTPVATVSVGITAGRDQISEDTKAEFRGTAPRILSSQAGGKKGPPEMSAPATTKTISSRLGRFSKKSIKAAASAATKAASSSSVEVQQPLADADDPFADMADLLAGGELSTPTVSTTPPQDDTFADLEAMLSQ